MIAPLCCPACGHLMKQHVETDIGYGSCLDPFCACRGWDGQDEEDDAA